MALQFSYDGSIKAITANLDCNVSFTLQGAGGGGGGNDDLSGGGPSRGSPGLPGSQVSGSIFLKAGETIYCAVGAGGKAGATTPGSGNSQGGIGGIGLDGFSGGTGGNAGTGGWSGAGGGGGAATVLWREVNGTRQYIAIAGGGGGGGGGGHFSQGYIRSTSPYGVVPSPYTTVQSYLNGVGSNGCGPAIGFGWLNPSQFTYYSPAPGNGAYSSMLNTYGVWNGNGQYYWQAYFPVSKNYTFGLSIDNDGSISIDGSTIRSVGGGEYDHFGSVWESTVYVTAGWHTIGVSAVNWHGPAALGFTVRDGSTMICNSRYPRNARDLGATWTASGFIEPGASYRVRFGNGIIPMLRNLKPDNCSYPTQDLIVVGENVTQEQLTAWGIKTPLSSIPKTRAGQVISWSVSYVADHNFDAGYWIWNASGAPTASEPAWLYRVTHGEGGRQSGGPSSSFTVPSSFTANSVLVFGCGDRWGGCPTGMNSIYFTMSVPGIGIETRGGKGQNHRGDGGGPGGGGAGVQGGQGGTWPGSDVGAMSGSTGYSTLNTNLASTSSNLFSQINNAGASQSNGGNGLAEFESVSNSINIYQSGWIKPRGAYVMNNNSWTYVKEIYVRQNDQWVRVYGDNIPNYSSIGGNFNTTSGPVLPY